MKWLLLASLVVLALGCPKPQGTTAAAVLPVIAVHPLRLASPPRALLPRSHEARLS
jgi:hypothetical protein